MTPRKASNDEFGMVHINKCLVKHVSNLTGNFINILVIRLPKCRLVKSNAKSSVFFDGENINEKIITSNSRMCW